MCVRVCSARTHPTPRAYVCARPPARAHTPEFVNSAVETFQLDIFRTDFNIAPLSAWRAGDAAKCTALDPSKPVVPKRTCPAFTLTEHADVPAGRFGPEGSSDVCEYAMPEDAATVEDCGKACCSNPNCTAFVFASAAANQHAVVSGTCPGCNGTCATATGACCYLKGGSTARITTPGRYTAGSVRVPPSRCQGVTENMYTHGLYAYWDAIRAANPHIGIDNCASGGNRIDLESLARTVFLWRNDNDNNILFESTDPVYQQADTLGLSAYAPVNNGNIREDPNRWPRRVQDVCVCVCGGGGWGDSFKSGPATIYPYFAAASAHLCRLLCMPPICIPLNPPSSV